MWSDTFKAYKLEGKTIKWMLHRIDLLYYFGVISDDEKAELTDIINATP